MEERFIAIRNWANDERPREKLLQQGVSVLSTTELLAIILRSGKKGESALTLARHILAACGNDLNKLAKLEVGELIRKYKGIGVAKAAGIVVAMELGRRRMLSAETVGYYIHSSMDVYNYISPLLKDLNHEEFWAVFLSRSNEVLGVTRLFSGGLSSTVIDVRLLFRKALETRASAVIVAHNHPSGSLLPSEYDKMITEKIKQGGLLLDIVLHDHIIIGGERYFSFVDEGIIIVEKKRKRKSRKAAEGSVTD